MQTNMGPADQIVRAIVGAGLILITALGAIGGVWKVPAVLIGCIAVFTASAGFCPAYRAMGLDRLRREREPARRRTGLAA